MTVIWAVKVVGDWISEHESGYRGDYRKLYDETTRIFGVWTYSMSHTSSYELSGKVKSYLTRRGIDESDIFEILCFLCLTIIHEAGYDQRIYGMINEALTYIAEIDGDEYARLHVKNLVELIETAEGLKSGIECRS